MQLVFVYCIILKIISVSENVKEIRKFFECLFRHYDHNVINLF